MSHPRFAFITLALLPIVVAQAAIRPEAVDLPAADAVKPVEVLRTGDYSEGICFDYDGNAYFSHAEIITKVTREGQASTWARTGAPNGHKVLRDGTHLVCDAGQHAVLHLDATGNMLSPASKECQGKPLRGPNDLCLDRDAGFYFTDPGGSEAEPIGTVHYVDGHGVTHLLAEGLFYPNGIVLSEDGRRLYVAESKRNRVLVFEVKAPGKLGPLQVFADLPAKEGEQIDNQPDGMCLDAAGNLYVAHYGMRQVQVLSPEGKLVRRYPGGNLRTSNVAFGGPKGEQLFVTGGEPGALYRLDLGVKGLAVLLPRKP